MIRVGHGYDVHRFAENRDLFLGGVKIEYELGLLGHSDADVLLHAIMDSVLGALALGIALYFILSQTNTFIATNSVQRYNK